MVIGFTVGGIIFMVKPDSNFIEAGHEKDVLVLNTNIPHIVIFGISMGEIENGSEVKINNKSSKKGDKIHLGDKIEVIWGEER